MNEWICKWTYEWIMNEWMKACMNDEWMDEWANECEWISKRKESTYCMYIRTRFSYKYVEPGIVWLWHHMYTWIFHIGYWISHWFIILESSKFKILFYHCLGRDEAVLLNWQLNRPCILNVGTCGQSLVCTANQHISTVITSNGLLVHYLSCLFLYLFCSY